MKFYTLKQVCEMTGFAYTTVIKYANIGIFPAIRIPNGRKAKYLFPAKDLDIKLESLRVSVV